MIRKYDAVIIGTGQGGIPLAIDLAEAGYKTAIIEKAEVGGSCINYGCTPTKTLIATAKAAHLLRNAHKYGISLNSYKINYKAVLERKNEIVEGFRNGNEKKIAGQDNLDFIKGTAEFFDKKTISISAGTEAYKISAEKIFINTGSSPFIPTISGLEKIQYLTSTSLLNLDVIPKHLVILGGGYIGLEFAQMFRRFGSEITIIERGDQLLSKEDEDISTEILEIFREDGINVQLNSSVNAVSPDGNIKVEVNTKDMRPSNIVGSHFLIAAGHTPNTRELKPDAAGIETDDKGNIKVNEKLETNVSGIYAIGDVKGGPAFTHISYDDYRVIRDNLLRDKKSTIKNRLIPYTVFIDPQLGRTGLTEKDAKKNGKKIKTAVMKMSSAARAIETGETRGLMKVVIDAGTDEILGCAILGKEGGEIASLIQVAMMGNLKYQAIREAVFSHPTLSESLNNLFDKIE